MTAIIKAVLRFLFKSVIQAALASIMQSEIREYWKKNRQKLMTKYVIPHLRSLLKAQAAARGFGKRIGNVWLRLRSVGRSKRQPETKTPQEPAKPSPEKRGAPKPLVFAEDDPTVAEVAGMLYRSARDRAARLFGRGKDVSTKTAKDGRTTDTDAPPGRPPSDRPAVSPDARQGRKTAPAPPGSRQERPREPEESNSDFTKRMEELIRKERAKRDDENED